MVALNVQQLKKKCLTESLTDETLLYNALDYLTRSQGRSNPVMRIFDRDHHLVVKMRSEGAFKSKNKEHVFHVFSRIFYRCG